ncbi:harpin-induced family protein, partial [Genlisea aurea]
HHHHHRAGRRKKILRRVVAVVGFLISLTTSVVFLAWLILRPTKPQFVLQDLAVRAFNLTAGNFLTAAVQATVSARNPNGRLGIYYDRLDISLAYHSQQITPGTQLSGGYQGHKDITVWSPLLYGSAVPVAPYLAAGLSQDLIAGAVAINIKLDGRIRWKLGTFITGKYHLYVNCPAYVDFGTKNIPGAAAGVKYRTGLNCNVDV